MTHRSEKSISSPARTFAVLAVNPLSADGLRLREIPSRKLIVLARLRDEDFCAKVLIPSSFDVPMTPFEPEGGSA